MTSASRLRPGFVCNALGAPIGSDRIRPAVSAQGAPGQLWQGAERHLLAAWDRFALSVVR